MCYKIRSFKTDLTYWIVGNILTLFSTTYFFYKYLEEMNLIKSKVLFITYKFVKGFLAITFLLLVISNWNFHDVCRRFLYNQKRNFSMIRRKMRNFPIYPHYKKEIAHSWNVMSIDMTLQKWAIFIMGVYGGNLCLLSDEILFLVI